jgi:hypothetical protein
LETLVRNVINFFLNSNFKNKRSMDQELFIISTLYENIIRNMIDTYNYSINDKDDKYRFSQLNLLFFHQDSLNFDLKRPVNLISNDDYLALITLLNNFLQSRLLIDWNNFKNFYNNTCCAMV